MNHNGMKEKLTVVIGPTAVGKTKLSIDLALHFNGEIISGDSMQVYRGMDIGTAKISQEEMQGIPHYMIDIKEPNESFSVAEFQGYAKEFISTINSRGKLPIIAGGTGLYIQSVIQDYQFADVVSDIEYRSILEAKAVVEGPEPLYQLLKKIDPESAAKIHPNNLRRVIRALEVHHKTGLTMTEYLKNQSVESQYHVALVGLSMEREMLYHRINARVDEMVENGLIEEVQRLYQQGLRNCQSIQAIGYKEIYQYLDGQTTREEAIDLLKRNSRRYAKRQLTWFRNKMDVKWFEMSESNYEEKRKEIFQYVAGKLQIEAN